MAGRSAADVLRREASWRVAARLDFWALAARDLRTVKRARRALAGSSGGESAVGLTGSTLGTGDGGFETRGTSGSSLDAVGCGAGESFLRLTVGMIVEDECGAELIACLVRNMNDQGGTE